MSTRLRDRQDDERRDTLAQMIVLDASRRLRGSGCSHLDAVNARVQAAHELLRQADRDASFAVEEGESLSEVGRALEMSRQAASKRYAHLKAVS
jgi:hypothetical protein